MSDDRMADALNVISHANSLTDNIFDIGRLRPLLKEDFKNQVSDSPLIYFLPGYEADNDGVLFVSRKEFPNFVADAVIATRNAKGALSCKYGNAVLEPIIDGRIEGVSYAVWPRHIPISNSRLIRAIQILLVSPKVFEWLGRIALETKRKNIGKEDLSRYIQTPLDSVANNTKLSERLRTLAKRSAQNLDDGSWSPFIILQHTDFWFGNILFSRRRIWPMFPEDSFYVIDWAGGITSGMPGFDLLRYCISARYSPRRARPVIQKYLDTIGLSSEELYSCLAVSLGRIRINLEQFPENRYLEMCEGMFNYLEATGHK